MRSLLQAGARVQTQLTARGLRFCFIGGIANFRWGTPRLTNDLDLTVLAGFGGEGPVITALLEDLSPRIPDAADFAWRHRVLLLRTADGVAVDVALGAMPFEEAAIARATDAELARGAVLRTCSATDLVVHKAFAARPQDWVDRGARAPAGGAGVAAALGRPQRTSGAQGGAGAARRTRTRGAPCGGGRGGVSAATIGRLGSQRTSARPKRAVRFASGQFTQQDPIGLAGGLNLYGYAGGDPINGSDPFGLAVIYSGESARQLFRDLQAQARRWATSEDADERARGTDMLFMMHRIINAKDTVEISIDRVFPRRSESQNEFGVLDNGHFGLNVTMQQFGQISLTTKLAHELGHAFATMHMGIPLPGGASANELSKQGGYARFYENTYRAGIGCKPRTGLIFGNRPCP